MKYSEKQIRECIGTLKPNGELFEVRFIASNAGKWNMSGYFDSPDILLEQLKKVHPKENAQAYITLNCIDKACFSRTQRNRFIEYASPTTNDGDIVSYSWFFIDLDCERPSGTSSTNEELEASKRKADLINEYLHGAGWNDPVVALSGNGIHLYYKLDLPNTAENKKLVEDCLKALDMLFSDSAVKVDTGTFNPARVCKLGGTLVQKGASTEERPHRMARIISKPDSIEINRIDLLQALADILPKSDSFTIRNSHKASGKFSLQDFIDRHNIAVTDVARWNCGTKYILAECPFDSSHKGKDASLFEFDDGRLGFHCFHAHCADKSWHDVRLLFEPDAYDDIQPSAYAFAPSVSFSAKNQNQQESFSKPLHFTDSDNAIGFSALYGNRMRYCASYGWLVFDGKVWTVDDSAVMRFALDYAETQLRDAQAEFNAEVHLAEGGNTNSLNSKRYLDFSLKTKNRNGLENMISLAESLCTIPASELNSNPFDLNCESGIIDLRTGEIRPHEPSALCTKISPFTPSDKGRARWENFLNMFLCGDAELIDYFQRCIGMSAIGKICEETMLIAVGDGSNGKSTTFGALSRVLGDYSGAVDASIFTSNSPHRLGFYAEIYGKRLCTCNELQKGDRLNAKVLKDVCSAEDGFGIKRLYHDIEYVERTHHVVMFSNYLPTIDSMDKGTWRRINILPCNAEMPTGDKAITNYADILVEECGGAILQWIVEGAVKFYQDGCRIQHIPKVVEEAKADYRIKEDWLQQFINDCCLEERNLNVGVQSLFKAYQNYCFEAGDIAHTQSEFKDAMLDRGFRRSNSGHHASSWHGIGLIDRKYDIQSYQSPFID